MDRGEITLFHIILTSLMIIDDFNIKDIAAFPYKTDPPLLVDTYAVLRRYKP